METTFEEATHANQIGYSDVKPFEIIRKISDKTIEIREMKAEILNQNDLKFEVGGFSAHCSNQHDQKYSFTSDESNAIIRVRKHKNGYYFCKYGSRHSLSTKAIKFYDYNF